MNSRWLGLMLACVISLSLVGCKAPTESPAREPRPAAVTTPSIPPLSVEPTVGTSAVASATATDLEAAIPVAEAVVRERFMPDEKFRIFPSSDKPGWAVSETWWGKHDRPPYKYLVLVWDMTPPGLGGFGGVNVAQEEADSSWTVIDAWAGF